MNLTRCGGWLTVLGVSAALGATAAAEDAGRSVVVVSFAGVVNPAAPTYIRRGVEEGLKRGAECVVVILDTPGGLMTSMDDIVKEFLNAKIPIVTYIAPKGARAASAGIFIALASHVIVMAPGTSMGAAHPVDAQGVMASEKIVNAAAATIRAIARERKRDAVWAESTVRKSKAITEGEGVTLGVVDFVADNLQDLLRQLDGRVVTIEKQRRTLHTQDASVVMLDMSQRERMLQTVADPNVAYVLFTLGMLGLIYEFSAPGFGFPGIVGSICLILALYAFNSISISLAGLLLLVVAMLLFFFEIKTPSHGALSVGGAIAFLFGSLLLFSPHVPAFRISLLLVSLITAMTFSFFMFVVTKGLMAQRMPVTSGKEHLIGMVGVAKSPLHPDGTVYLNGEHWSAVSEGGTIHKGASVQVVGFDGVKLKVTSHGGVV